MTPFNIVLRALVSEMGLCFSLKSLQGHHPLFLQPGFRAASGLSSQFCHLLTRWVTLGKSLSLSDHFCQWLNDPNEILLSSLSGFPLICSVWYGCATARTHPAHLIADAGSLEMIHPPASHRCTCTHGFAWTRVLRISYTEPLCILNSIMLTIVAYIYSTPSIYRFATCAISLNLLNNSEGSI